LTLLASLAGCAKKVTTADASYTTLEGKLSPEHAAVSEGSEAKRGD